MLRWTDWVIRHRKRVLGGWIVVFVLGAAATSTLGSLLTNRFSVPGSDAERGLNLVKKKFHERGDGAFTLVLQAKRGTARDRDIFSCTTTIPQCLEQPCFGRSHHNPCELKRELGVSQRLRS